jgi:hypothetical protein
MSCRVQPLRAPVYARDGPARSKWLATQMSFVI